MENGIPLAAEFGTVVINFSGCPGGCKADKTPNFVTCPWPDDYANAAKYQWDEVLIPYWHGLVATARDAGVGRLCLELHGQQNVYNVATMMRLRDAVGDVVGTNFDPSHLMWMGADPMAAIRALGDAIYHVHAKDTRIDVANAGVNSVIDTTPMDALGARSWGYVTLGFGHDLAWWREFCTVLRRTGYDDVLSIEHEDFSLTPEDGVRESVLLLNAALGRRG